LSSDFTDTESGVFVINNVIIVEGTINFSLENGKTQTKNKEDYSSVDGNTIIIKEDLRFDMKK
jgi:hypothetical protein